MGSIRVIRKKTGEESYHAEVRLRGFVERQTFRTKTQAKSWVQKTEAAIKDGRYKSQSAARVHTVGNLIDRFISEGVPKQYKYFAQRVQLLTRWRQELGHLLLCDLSPSHIAAVRDKLLSETTLKKGLRTPSTVNRYLTSFSKALTIAIKEWGWLDENPMVKIQKPPENPGRERLLNVDEKDRLLEACKTSTSPFLFPIVMMAFLTGMRSGEILNLRWKDIDFMQHTITLHKTKNGDTRVVPLTDVAAEVLKKSPNPSLRASL
jgi:integrase